MNENAALWFCVTILILFFSGEPDLLTVLIEYIGSLND